MTGQPKSFTGAAAMLWGYLVLGSIVFALGYLAGNGQGRSDCVEVDNVTFNIP